MRTLDDHTGSGKIVSSVLAGRATSQVEYAGTSSPRQGSAGDYRLFWVINNVSEVFCTDPSPNAGLQHCA